MAFKRPKIAVIGAGFTGATTALMIAQKDLGDVILVDTPEQSNPTKGKALDLLEAGPVQRFNARVRGTADYRDIEGADMVIITAGIARKPGMSRDDLVSTNAKIMRSISLKVKEHAPDSFILVLSNPVDAMTYVCYQTTQFPKHRVIGQSGVLDTARFNTFVAEELNISVEDISGFVLGGHGDDMVPLVRYSYAGGIPLEKIIPADRLEAIVERTRKGGGEIVNLLGNGSAYYAPAASLVEMAEAIIRDKKRILPSIAYLEGEYGYHDLYLGVPTILGGEGIESIIELPLTAAEKAALDRSVHSVKQVMAILEN
ncbi:malate dehydrogenase [Bacillus badius]|uniref:Malate dehydrogenase n=1 Tax=Bacillus badius TaxID=1455 RepID=A0ABR5AUZ0_BACBA|nr:malate dehydrogenase [Bacillus badius]KIL76449.1 Malate dehydrogenase [Bacillus badius]KIL78566.1 Malate dehydrogenase [Bacillus badius]KZO00050.1 malate dehydrogenase [Bacillus badius]KZR58674.1 malate dehydrogenase [Bacillus badius]MED0665533.1 malate dehydrogenase [Bacillus badius]